MTHLRVEINLCGRGAEDFLAKVPKYHQPDTAMNVNHDNNTELPSIQGRI